MREDGGFKLRNVPILVFYGVSLVFVLYQYTKGSNMAKNPGGDEENVEDPEFGATYNSSTAPPSKTPAATVGTQPPYSSTHQQLWQAHRSAIITRKNQRHLAR